MCNLVSASRMDPRFADLMSDLAGAVMPPKLKICSSCSQELTSLIRCCAQ